jgi:hypothetical protein
LTSQLDKIKGQTLVDNGSRAVVAIPVGLERKKIVNARLLISLINVHVFIPPGMDQDACFNRKTKTRFTSGGAAGLERTF